MAIRIANKGITASGEVSEAKKLDAPDIRTLIDQQITPLKEELYDYKTKIIEVLGIFVALFTFISVDFQIFSKNVSLLSAVGLSLIVLASLIFFIIILSLVVATSTFLKETRGKFVFFSTLIVLLLGGGVGLVYYENKAVLVTQDKLQENNESYYTKDEIDKLLARPTNHVPANPAK